MSNSLVVFSQVNTRKALVTILHTEGNQVAVGTGFFIQGPDSGYRYILTCAHCIIDYTNAASILYATDLNVSHTLAVSVHYENGILYTGSLVEVIGFDFLLDVAYLRIPAVENSPVPVTLQLGNERDSNLCFVGAEVYAPKYDIQSDTLSFVEGRVINALTQFGQSSYPDCVLCNLPMQPGNSGSPVMVTGNVVIGVTSFLFPKNSTNQQTAVIGAHLIQYLINYFNNRVELLKSKFGSTNMLKHFPIQYPLQCLGFDYTFNNMLTVLPVAPYNNSLYVRRLHYHHVPSNPHAHLKVTDVITKISNPENNNTKVSVRNNIFKILYKLGNGNSHMDVLNLVGSCFLNGNSATTNSFVLNSFVYSLTTPTPLTIEGSLVTGSIVVSKQNSLESWTLSIVGTAIAGVMAPAITNNRLSVVNGSTLLTLRTFDPPHDMFKNFKITGVLMITNDVISTLPTLKVKVTSLGGINSDNLQFSGSLSSTLSALPNLSQYQLSVDYNETKLDTDGNVQSYLPSETIVLNSEDFHFNMLDYVPTYRQLLDNATFISYEIFHDSSYDLLNSMKEIEIDEEIYEWW